MGERKLMDRGELATVIGMERSGTIWLTRMLADALGVGSRSRYRPNPFTNADDPAVSRLDSERFIRRLHYSAPACDYDSPQVLIVRDPRDIAVSQAFYYHHDPNLRAMYVAGGEPPSNWQKFYLGWLTDPRLVVYTRYEDLRADPLAELSRILRTLPEPFPSEGRIEQAVYDNEFNRMNNPLKRKGSVGDYINHLSPEAIAAIARGSGEGMRRFGYT